jgi:hypothetical protein
LNRLLILYDYFDPAYKAGGPIRSLVNLVKVLEEQMDIHILSSDRDHDGTALKVESDRWIAYGKRSKVQYLSVARQNRQYISKIIREVDADVIYVNGIYSLPFAAIPLRLLRGLHNVKKVIAPRGMLQKEPLSIKPFKKLMYLYLFQVAVFEQGHAMACDNPAGGNRPDDCRSRSQACAANWQRTGIQCRLQCRTTKERDPAQIWNRGPDQPDEKHTFGLGKPKEVHLQHRVSLVRPREGQKLLATVWQDDRRNATQYCGAVPWGNCPAAGCRKDCRTRLLHSAQSKREFRPLYF